VIHRAACVLLVAALAGCATPRAPSTPDELTGRLSVRVESQPPKSVNSAFELRGTADRGELVLTSPLGNMLAQARWEPGSAELRTSDGSQRFADLDSLAFEALGEALPLAALFDWLRGRPWSGAPSTPQAAGFDQLGWRVDLARASEGWIVATRERAPVVTVRARLEAPK
jgi:outer membrane lipoprotein LolB